MVSPVVALTDALNRYVVRPSNAFGLGGFVFDVDGETTINLRTDITDHYLEDNTTVQDHIAVKPKKVTLKSYVGELVYRPENDGNTAVQRTVRKLTVLNSYLPQLTAAAQAIKNAATREPLSVVDSLQNVTAQTVNKAVDYYSLARNVLNTDSRQQQAYLYFKALMEQKILVSLQTPFEYVNNMAIESITAYQGENSKFISDFSITLKEIRVVEVLNAPTGSSRYQVEEGSDDQFQGRAAAQYDPVENIGNISGQEAVYPINDYLPSGNLPSVLIDPLDLPEGLTAEEFQAAVEFNRNYSAGQTQPVVELFKAGAITNANDE